MVDSSVARETSMATLAGSCSHRFAGHGPVPGPGRAFVQAVSDRPHGTADDVAKVVRTEIGAISPLAAYDASGSGRQGPHPMHPAGWVAGPPSIPPLTAQRDTPGSGQARWRFPD